jgi:hypothetical protein
MSEIGDNALSIIAVRTMLGISTPSMASLSIVIIQHNNVQNNNKKALCVE